MSNVRIVDKMPQFKISARNVLDDALKEGARDILIKAKNKAPYDKGGLRGNTEISTPKLLSKRISFGIEYARFQEFGGDDKRTVKNYTTAGTGKHYLKNAGDEVARTLGTIFKKHGMRARP
jgi:hypothetical protein